MEAMFYLELVLWLWSGWNINPISSFPNAPLAAYGSLEKKWYLDIFHPIDRILGSNTDNVGKLLQKSEWKCIQENRLDYYYVSSLVFNSLKLYGLPKKWILNSVCNWMVSVLISKIIPIYQISVPPLAPSSYTHTEFSMWRGRQRWHRYLVYGPYMGLHIRAIHFHVSSHL